MSIYKRGHTYYIRKTINGSCYHFSLKTDNYHLAKELCDTFIRDALTQVIRQKTGAQPRTGGLFSTLENRPPLIKAFNEFLRSLDKKNMSATHKGHRERIRGILKEQGFEWENINPREVDDLQRKLRVDFAPHTAFKIIGGLISFLRFAIKRAYFTQNEYAMLDFMKEPPTTKRRVIFSDQDIESIIFYCKQRGDLDFLYFILVLYFTASRPGEIVNLRYKDIDFKNERVSVWMSKIKRYKTVSLPRFFLDELMNLIKFNERTDGYLFVGQGRQKEFYAKKFKAMKEALGLNPEYSLYLFRHTAGTKALGMSQNIHLVKELLGHENISTTDKYYMLDNPEHTRPVTDKLIEGIYGNSSFTEGELRNVAPWGKRGDKDDNPENSTINK